MISRCYAVLVVALLGAVACWGQPAAKPIPAFPGAEGFGASTPGGRGGKVIKVTNLNASGPGSLQEACSTPGPRIVVFEVSGVIDGDVEIREPYITIAGQTAPGAGITIYGQLSAYRPEPEPPVHDIIVRFLRVRCQPGKGDLGDALAFSAVDNVIIDHCSFAWAEDETIDLYTHATNVTIQWSTIEESTTIGHPEGVHNTGLIAGRDSHNISLHHNLFAHQSGRCPLIVSGPADFRNNVIYNCETGWQGDTRMVNAGFNLIGNHYKPGPTAFPIPFSFPEGHAYYVRSNYLETVGMIEDPWAGTPNAAPGFSHYAKGSVKQETETPVPLVKTHTPQMAYRLVLAFAGCFPRDQITLRTIEDARNGTGSWGRKDPVSRWLGYGRASGLLTGLVTLSSEGIDKDGYLDLVRVMPPHDTSGDGIPDMWQIAQNLDPRNDDSKTVMPSGYTAIEEYANELADALIQVGW